MMWCHVTTTGTGSALLAVAAANGVVAARHRAGARDDDKNHNNSVIVGNLLSMVINLVAFLHYHRMLALPSGADWSVVRYSDWLVTCPLLTVELGLLLGLAPLRKTSDTVRVACAALCSATMVAVGLAARHRSGGGGGRLALWALGCVLLLGVGASLLGRRTDDGDGVDDRESTRRRAAALVFLLLWVPYGVVFWVRSPAARNAMYNVLDFLSKVGLGLYMLHTAFTN